MCAKAGWAILKDIVWLSRTTFLLSSCLSSFCPPPLSSLTGFRPNLVLVLHPLSCPRCPFSLPRSPLPLPLPLSLFSSYHSVKYFLIPFLSLRSLSPGVAGEIRGYNFLQSAESGPQHLTPSPIALPPPPSASHTNPHHGQGQRNTSSLSEKPPCVLPFTMVGSLSSSDRGGKNKPTQRKRGTNEDAKQMSGS